MVGKRYLLGAASGRIWTVTSGTLRTKCVVALDAVGHRLRAWSGTHPRVPGRKPNLPGVVLGAIAWIAAAMTLAGAGLHDAGDDRARHCCLLCRSDGHRIMDRAPPTVATALAPDSSCRSCMVSC